MFAPFDALPETAKVWIYQANRKFALEEEKIASHALENLCKEWLAHGEPLRTSYKIEYHQFIILAVDEGFNNASGCSIDGSVRVLKELQSRLGVDFFDRTNVAFLIDDDIRSYPLSEIRSLFSSSKLLPKTTTFNNFVTTKSDFERNWKTPAEKTWLIKYLPKTALTS